MKLASYIKKNLLKQNYLFHVQHYSILIYIYP